MNRRFHIGHRYKKGDYSDRYSRISAILLGDNNYLETTAKDMGREGRK